MNELIKVKDVLSLAKINDSLDRRFTEGVYELLVKHSDAKSPQERTGIEKGLKEKEQDIVQALFFAPVIYSSNLSSETMFFIKTRLSELAKSIPMVRSYLLRQGVFRNPDESWKSEVVSILANSGPLGSALSDELIAALKSDSNGQSILLPLIFQLDSVEAHEGLIKGIIEQYCHSTGTDDEYIQIAYDAVIAPCLRSSCTSDTKQHSLYQFLNNVPHPENGKPYDAQLRLLANLNFGDINHSGMIAIIDGSNRFMTEKSNSTFHEPRHNYVRYLLTRSWNQYAKCEKSNCFVHAEELMQRSLNKGYAASGILCTDRKFMNIDLYDDTDMLKALEEFLTKLEAPELKKAIAVQIALANSATPNPIRNPELKRVLKTFWDDCLSDPERNHARSEASGILGGTMNLSEGSGSKGKRGSGELA